MKCPSGKATRESFSTASLSRVSGVGELQVFPLSKDWLKKAAPRPFGHTAPTRPSGPTANAGHSAELAVISEPCVIGREGRHFFAARSKVEKTKVFSSPVALSTQDSQSVPSGPFAGEVPSALRP